MMTRAMIACLLCVLGLPAAIRAVETEVLFDGSAAQVWDNARDANRLAREFSQSRVAVEGTPPMLRWQFVPKQAAFNDLFLRQPISRPFTAVRVKVRNPGEPFTVAAKIGDAEGAEWTVGRVPLSRGEDWRWIEFPAETWALASWSAVRRDSMAYPLKYFTLIAFGIASGKTYELNVSRVEFVRPDPPVAVLHRFTFPQEMAHGRSYTASLRVELDKPCMLDGAWLVFRRGATEAFRRPMALPSPLGQWKSGQAVELNDVPVAIGEFASGGPHAVSLELGEAKVLYNGRRMDETPYKVNIQARTPKRTTASVRNHHGSPTLFIDDKPHPGMAYAAYQPSVKVFHDFAQAGVDLFTFCATPTESGYGLSKTTWTAPGTYDFSELDQRVMMVLEANPQAYFFPRLYLHAPKWWSQQHPDDVVLMDLGDGKPIPFLHAGDKPAPSWGSPAWRRDTVEGLRRLIAHVESSPYADRCIGYHIASGTTEEWMMWGANENQWVDFSPANQAAFRQWLRIRYGTVERLREAWGNAGVSLETASIPSTAQRRRAEFGSLRDPAKEQPVVDFYQFNSDLVGDTICHFAKAIKGITRREKIVGVFYGYTLQLCGEPRQQNAGHLALGRVLASPDVDFLCSPTSYAFRQLGGEGTCHFMSLADSVRLHGKLWFDENDIRTSLAPGRRGEWGRPDNVDGDIVQQEKELAKVFTSGAAQWWFDVGRNRYDDPALMRRIAALTSNAAAVQQLNREPADQVAMVVDEQSLCYLRPGEPLGASLLVQQLPALSRIGSPVGHYLAADLPRITDRKVFLFMTSLAPSAADRAAIDALKKDGRVLVFFYAPGLYREGRVDESALEALTGIRLKMAAEPTELRVTLRPGHAMTAGLAGQVCGVRYKASPACYAEDPQAVVLGTLPSGCAGLAVKSHPEWTAVFSAAPMLPASLLRRIASLGNVHTYIDSEDVVWASQGLVAVCVNHPGVRKIFLPHPRAVRDLYTNQRLSETAVRSFEADFAPHATRVFAVDP